jgi:hypothetical protein
MFVYLWAAEVAPFHPATVDAGGAPHDAAVINLFLVVKDWEEGDATSQHRETAHGCKRVCRCVCVKRGRLPAVYTSTER